MSRLNSLSASAVRAMFSSETDEQLIMLLTIYDPYIPSGFVGSPPATVRLADGYTQRLTNLTTDDEVYYGVTSRSNDFLFLPMSLALPSEQDTGVGQCSLTLNYVTPEAIEMVRKHLTKPCKVLIELILSGHPDVVEASFPGFYITSATYNANAITLSLNMISLNTEPFPSFNFTPSYFPGLF